jgi:SPP1 family predicted phage head-tail adaptor
MSNSIGKMRYRVKVENATNTRDAGGGLSQSYSAVTFIYANIKPLNANSIYRQGIVQEKVTHEITLRYMKNISTNSRITYGSRNFNIKGIINVDERDRFLKLLCEEGVAI